MRLIGALLLMLSFAGSANAQEGMPDFAADVTNTTAGQSMTSRVYASGEKMRMEMPDMLMIVRKDLNLTWMVMTAQGLYLEQPIDLNTVAKVSRTLPGETQRVSLGKENINGVEADKFKVTYTSMEGVQSVYQWMTTASVPVRMAAVDGTWSVDYTNIDTKKQDPSLFELPQGVQKMDMSNLAQEMRHGA